MAGRVVATAQFSPSGGNIATTFLAKLTVFKVGVASPLKTVQQSFTLTPGGANQNVSLDTGDLGVAAGTPLNGSVVLDRVSPSPMPNLNTWPFSGDIPTIAGGVTGVFDVVIQGQMGSAINLYL